MSPCRLGRIVLAGAVFAVACRESTGPGTTVVPGAITWIEWPAAVTASHPESLRISGFLQCPYVGVWRAAINGTEVHIAAWGHERDIVCLDSGTGSGYDTLLVLPRLTGGPVGTQSYSLWVPVTAATVAWRFDGNTVERKVGTFDLRAVPDTTTDMAGWVMVTQDSLGCWRARPLSAWPSTPLALAAAPNLVPAPWGQWAYLAGHLVPGSPAPCGDVRSISASTLQVDAIP
jgi:hypothetical protein